MAGPTTETFQTDVGSGQRLTALGRWASGETGSMGWTRFDNCELIAEVSGTATAVNIFVDRSATDPAGPIGALSAPADSTGFSGDLSGGIAPNVYQEAGVGWWRIRVTSSTGGTINGTLSGPGE